MWPLSEVLTIGRGEERAIQAKCRLQVGWQVEETPAS
jgi:hypothetical protein